VDDQEKRLDYTKNPPSGLQWAFLPLKKQFCAIEKDEMAVKAKIAKSLFLDFCFIKDRNGKSTGEFKEYE
jgi:hypothetical protein